MIFQSLSKYFFHDLKLKYKFIFTHLILVFFPTVLLSMFLFGQLSKIVTNNTIRSQEALVTQTATSVGANIGQVSLAMDSITQNQFLSELFYTYDWDALTGKDDFLGNSNQFLSTVNTMVDDEFITDVKIYVAPGHEVILDHYAENPLFLPMEEAKKSHWYGIFAGSGASSLLCPSFYLSNTELENYGELAYIKKVNMIGIKQGYAGYVAIYFSKDYLTNILRQNMTTKSSASYIVNERNNTVATTNSTLTGMYFLDYDVIPETIPDTENFITQEILGDSLYLGYRIIPNTNWYLVSVIPVDSVFSEEGRLLQHTIILYVIVVVIACGTALLLSGSIAKRVSSVIEKMETAKHGKPKHLHGDIEKDEIGQLVTTYNYMVDQINTLIEEQTKIANELKVSEFKALQAQINPHFLYNMLDMINWLSKSGQNEGVSEAVHSLSRYYKLTLNKGNITTSIKDELDHVSLYVKLQNMRYENKIQFIVDVPDEILDYEIPKLVLQPIVENCILHGIFEQECKEGTIVITSWLEGEYITFLVSDNGVGIPADKLPTILTGKGISETGGSNIAIYNTHLRLQLLYGNQYGLVYHSIEGEGTDVEIRIPAKKTFDSPFSSMS